MRRLATFCYRHRWWVVAFWIVAIVAVMTLGRAFGGELTNNFELPNTESRQAYDVLKARFPEQAGDTAQIVFKSDAPLTDPAVKGRVDAVVRDVAAVRHVVGVQSVYEQPARTIAPGGHIGFATVQLDKPTRDLGSKPGERITQIVERARGDGLDVEAGGNPIEQALPRALPASEAIGLLAAMVILLISFGSLIAMGAPIITALFGLGVGVGSLTLIAAVLDVPRFGPQMAAMIGLGVGIDYALFIVTRFRQELHAGREPERAVVVALDTSGRAVLFAGTTVVISLLGMFLMGLSFVRGLATGAIVAVAMVMLASVTLMPAVLGFAGRAIDRWRVPFLHRDESEHRRTVWFRWSRLVQHNPWPAALAGLAVLVVLAVPVFSLHLGNSDAGNDPTRYTTRRSYDLLKEGFGAGFNGRLLVVATTPDDGARAAVARLDTALARTPGVANVSPPRANPAGDVTIINVVPETSPQSTATEDLVNHLRATVIPDALHGTNSVVKVGGTTATSIDISQYLADRLPIFFGAVLTLSFLLLMIVFRSLLVPIKAVIMNVLSIAAAFGLVVAIFQWGWLADVVGIAGAGPIEAFIPMMLFAVLFGLSMDYEVFLLSRVREEYDRTGDNGLAVADGLAATARVITAAAAIMIAVFLSFVLGDERVIKLFGLGMAGAILIDATLVRLLLVPATMELLGDANWWLPRWLDRILPRVRIEHEEEPPPEGGAPTPDRTLEPVG